MNPAPTRSQPNLISVTTIAADGSRKFLHPSDAKGPFTTWRRIAALVLLAVYVLLPWIPVNGFPAVFLDTANRRFHFFGFTFVTQDLWRGFFVVTGLAFSLFYISSLFGRIWCGWTCPYTVFLENIYRRIERWVEGDAPARRKLDAAPWDKTKIFKRVLKHTLYLVASAAIAHVFLSYFVSIKELYSWMHSSPLNHAFAFGVVVFFTVCLYFSFSWFREQFCIILCPYGRLQSALTNDDTVVIGYDKKRGEPRGKAGTEGAGDCINCTRCVQVCPTGIDIRNGLQLECIGCAACVDACDDVMAKLHRPKGLVRYDSLNGLGGKRTRFIRARTIFYTVMLLVGAVAFGWSLTTLKPIHSLAKRQSGAPFFLNEGAIRNQFNVRVTNKRHETNICTISLGKNAPPSLRIDGATEPFEVPALGEVEKLVILTMPNAEFNGVFNADLIVAEKRENGASTTHQVEFLGPDTSLRKYGQPKQ